MKRSELPLGNVTAIAYSEKENVVVRLLDNSTDQPRLFLLRPTDRTSSPVAAQLPPGFVYSEIASVPGVASVLCLVRGPSVRRGEPLILRTTYLWVLDLITESISPLVTNDEHSVMKLIGPSEIQGEVVCITSTSHRTETLVVVDYHIARVSVQTGAVVVLQQSIALVGDNNSEL